VNSIATGSMGRPNAPKVEQVAARILENCLINDGSLFTPGAPIWTPENLAELHVRYVDAPDVSAKSFDDKLEIQLAEVSDQARQLFAELYVLNLLPVIRRNFLQATKIANIERILAPIKPAITIPPDVREAFSDGVFNGGRAWMNRRWAQLSFLVEFAEHFKQQDPSTREAARREPDVLRRIVMESPGHPEPAQRRALLWLFQPRYFLPIVSEEHQRQLRAGLGPQYLPEGPTADLDADLRTIIEALEEESGNAVDVYDDTWRPKWLDKKTQTAPQTPLKSPGESQSPVPEPRPYSVADIVQAGSFHPAARLQHILDHWREKQNLVLQGAPGTGKTWLAKRLAEALIGSHAPDAIRSVQFHPNTSYEDFVRGWRPTAGGNLVLTDGALLQHAERARKSDIPHVLIIEEINRGNPAQAFGEMLTLIEKSKRNAEDALTLSYPRFDGEQFFLPDNLYLLGTMNIADRSLALVDFALRRRFSFETLEPALNDAWAQYLRAKLPRNDSALVATIQSRIVELNERISTDPMLGRHFKIGHSFLTPTESQSDGRVWFSGVVDTEIAPLLYEYWFDDREKAQEAIDALRV
jgi:hypothetical protein